MKVVSPIANAYRDDMPRSPANADGLSRYERRWPDPAEGPWVVSLMWAEVDGRPECVGVSVGGGGKPIPATLLRQIPFGDFIADVRAELAPAVEMVSGMRTSAAERLRSAAEVYQRALAEGRRPSKAVAEHFGISTGGASNLVARARAAGMLPPTSAGKAVG